MKLFKYLFILLFITQIVEAQKIQSHVLELQNRIEAQIDRNLSNLISTQLQPGTFDVSTRVKVVEIPPPPPKPDKKKPAEEMPAGLELGSIDVREVISAYQREIDELKAFKEQTKEEKPESKYSVNRVEVVVGLNELYDDQYVAQFQDWLSKRVKADYGSAAIATVNKTQPAPVKEIPPKEFGWKDLLPYLSYLLLALGLIIAAWFIARGLTKLGQGVKNIVIEHKNPFTLDHNQKLETQNTSTNKIEEESERTYLDSADELAQEREVDQLNEELEGDDMLGKIVYLCLELGNGVNDLVRTWLDNGHDGFIKTAILVDTIVGLKEKASGELLNNKSETESESNVIKFPLLSKASELAKLKIPLDPDLTSMHAENLREAYREASTMNIQSKKEFLDKIYWDMLQIKTLGLQNMRKPFDYLQSMNDMAFAEVIKTQPDETKALALMFGDANKTKIFMSSVATSEKEKIVQNMISMSQVSTKQIWDADSSLKLKLINSALNPSESLVNLFPRTVDMLNSLNPVDEIKVLRSVSHTLPDQGVSVKQQFTTVAFIDQWYDEYILKLTKLLNSNELVHLLQIIPDAKQAVLSVLPEKMRMIVEEDLQVVKIDDQAIEKSMKQIKAKWRQICNKENIAMGSVVNFDLQEWKQNAA